MEAALAAEAQKPELIAEAQKPALTAEAQKPAPTAEAQKPELIAEAQEPELIAEAQKPTLATEAEKPANRPFGEQLGGQWARQKLKWRAQRWAADLEFGTKGRKPTSNLSVYDPVLKINCLAWPQR
jgi:hypothetical protein